jgi:hypothetical protein
MGLEWGKEVLISKGPVFPGEMQALPVVVGDNWRLPGSPVRGMCLELKIIAYLLLLHTRETFNPLTGGNMKTSYLGVLAFVGIAAATLFFISREGEARMGHEPGLMMHEASVPYHRYKLQYSYNGRTWHDLITIENGELSKNVTYLRRGNKVPSLRYFYTYVDAEGEQRVLCIPLTVESPPEPAKHRV